MKRLIPILVFVSCGAVAVPAVDAAISPHDLRIDPGAFSPAQYKSEKVATNANLQAARLLADMHSTTYDAMGRVKGYKQLATYHHVDIIYWPSVFSTAAQAKAAWKDSAIGFPTRHQATSQTCVSGSPVSCKEIEWDRRQTGGGIHVINYQVMHYNTCLVEIASTGTLSAWHGARHQVQVILANVGRAAAIVLQQTCKGPVSFHFDRLQTSSTRGQTQTSFKVNQPFVLNLAWTVRNLPKKSAATLAFDYERQVGGGWQKATSITETVPTTNGRNLYRKQSQLTASGTFRITVAVTVKGTKPQTKTVTVQISG